MQSETVFQKSAQPVIAGIFNILVGTGLVITGGIFSVQRRQWGWAYE